MLTLYLTGTSMPSLKVSAFRHCCGDGLLGCWLCPCARRVILVVDRWALSALRGTCSRGQRRCPVADSTGVGKGAFPDGDQMLMRMA